ncbi:Reverse transcriptase-like [Sesbania bispinosa]|nr:Reverse transcriptase-like [Sesbania bispinosa]
MDGGLGFRDFSCLNLAHLAKQARRILEKPYSFWAQFLKGIYFPHSDFLHAKKGSMPSWIWASIVEVTSRDSVRNIKPGAYWKCPLPGVLQCNIDAAWHGSLIPRAIAFVVRDSTGRFLTDHAKKVPASSPLSLRLWLCGKQCWLRTILIGRRKERFVAEIKGIVEDILTVADGFMRCGFTWVQRQANTVAHLLAQKAYSGSLPANWLSSQPDWLRQALIKDCSLCPASSLVSTLQTAHSAAPL